MEDDVVNSSTEESGAETKGVSRREFIRKSAEVACMSLFGVLAFDSVANKVLEVISERQSIGRIGEAVASGLPKSFYDVTIDCQPPSSYSCPDLGSGVTCTNLYHNTCARDDQFGCTIRKLTCDPGFECGSYFNCKRGVTYFCDNHICGHTLHC